MKKFKQFRGEQQYITEVGPFASAMMSAMAIFGGGMAAWKLYKTGKEKIKGYKETKAEKKENQENGSLCYRDYYLLNNQVHPRNK